MIASVCIRRCSAGRFYEWGDIGNLKEPNRHFIPIKGDVPEGSVGATLLASTQDPAGRWRFKPPDKIVFQGLYRAQNRQFFFCVSGEEGKEAKLELLTKEQAEKLYPDLVPKLAYKSAFPPPQPPDVRWRAYG